MIKSTGTVFTEFLDKKVKPAKCYYYKVCMKADGDKRFGPMSKPTAYWTAPKPKVKKTYDNTKVGWKKVKGATGYIVTEDWIEFAGYNIFGQKLSDSFTKQYMTKARKYTKKHYRITESGKKYPSEVKLTTYAKHGK